MKFLIQHNIFDEERQDIIMDTVKHLPHSLIGMIPISHAITSNDELDLTSKDYIPYGSTDLIKKGKELQWKGCFYNDIDFDYKKCIKYNPYMLNRITFTVEQLLQFAEVPPLQEKNWFVKPSKNRKAFSGFIGNRLEVKELLEEGLQGGSSRINAIEKDDILVLGYPLSCIVAEWRCFIINGSLVSISQYRKDGRQFYSDKIDLETFDFIEMILDTEYLPHPTCVVDICLEDNGTYSIVEFNAINSSGFYQHDMKKVFTKLYEYTNKI